MNCLRRYKSFKLGPMSSFAQLVLSHIQTIVQCMHRPSQRPVSVPIPVPHGAHNTPRPSLASLRFSPLGLYYWRIWQGFFPEGGSTFFVNNIERFRAANIAFFAAGMAYDGLHDHPQNQFHPFMKNLIMDTKNSDASRAERKELIVELQRLLWDIVRVYVYFPCLFLQRETQAACLDRVSGGTTMVLHSSGTTVPGAPHRSEYLKALGYLPPAFVRHNPQMHSAILQIVQLFIENIAVKTSDDWTACIKSHLGWTLKQTGNPQPNRAVIGMPAPDVNSAQYTFLGQPSGDESSPTNTTSSSSNTSFYPLSNTNNNEQEILDLKDSIRDLENTNTILLNELQQSHVKIKMLESQLEMSSGPSTRAPARRVEVSSIPGGTGTPNRTPTRHAGATPGLNTTPSKP